MLLKPSGTSILSSEADTGAQGRPSRHSTAACAACAQVSRQTTSSSRTVPFFIALGVQHFVDEADDVVSLMEGTVDEFIDGMTDNMTQSAGVEGAAEARGRNWANRASSGEQKTGADRVPLLRVVIVFISTARRFPEENAEFTNWSIFATLHKIFQKKHGRKNTKNALIVRCSFLTIRRPLTCFLNSRTFLKERGHHKHLPCVPRANILKHDRSTA